MLRKVLTTGLVALGVLVGPQASAALYNYSFDMTNGPINGIVSGQIDLPFVAPGGSGSGAASLVTIDVFPAGLAPLPEPSPATGWGLQVANSFTVVNGVITDYVFFALTGSGGTSAYELCFNSGPGLSGGDRFCPENLNFLGDGGATLFGYNLLGPEGISFSLAQGAPEPGTLALLGLGLAGLAVRRRRSH